MVKYYTQLMKTFRGMATSTSPKLKAYAPTADQFSYHHHGKKLEVAAPARRTRDFVPVYVAVGMIGLAALLGLHTGKQQLLHSPNVFVKKRHHHTLLEVVEPEHVLKDAEKFIKKSFFRKFAHIQDPHKKDYAIKIPNRG